MPAELIDVDRDLIEEYLDQVLGDFKRGKVDAATARTQIAEAFLLAMRNDPGLGDFMLARLNRRPQRGRQTTD